MYTRQLNRKKRVTPPPGYMGTAFRPDDPPMEGKVHSPEPPSPTVSSTPEPVMTQAVPDPIDTRGEVREGASVLGELLGELRGRIGPEELILLLVMLLLASDGAGSEVLLLALLLFGGGEEAR